MTPRRVDRLATALLATVTAGYAWWMSEKLRAQELLPASVDLACRPAPSETIAAPLVRSERPQAHATRRQVHTGPQVHVTRQASIPERVPVRRGTKLRPIASRNDGGAGLPSQPVKEIVATAIEW